MFETLTRRPRVADWDSIGTEDTNAHVRLTTPTC